MKKNDFFDGTRIKTVVLNVCQANNILLYVCFVITTIGKE